MATDEEVRRLAYRESLAWLTDLHERAEAIRANETVRAHSADDSMELAVEYLEVAYLDVLEGFKQEFPEDAAVLLE